MKKAILWGVGIFIVVSAAGTVQAADPYTAGEKWTYEHEGAVPMRPPDYTITGDRVREVVGMEGEGENKRWLILEQWGDNDEWAGKRHVNADRRYDKIDSGGDRVMTIEPPYPFDYLDLKPGEEKKLESTFQAGERWSFPLKLGVKRVKDETIKVPAGKFENCVHVQCEESVTFTGQDGNEMTITTKSERWCHPKVNGLVKEVFTREGPGGESNKGTSELKSYTKEKKE